MTHTGGAATIDSSESARRAAATARSALPTQVSNFIGRERELVDLETLLAKARLVTLTGTGGSGKTRLALELAARVRDRVADGTCFVDLAPITDPELVPATIAATLGIRGDPRRPLLGTLAERLAERRLLLILDNLEQLPDGVRGIAELLGRCPNLRVLATSRARLHLRGEQDYPVDPLGLPNAEDLGAPELLGRTEAVRLFIDRARAVKPGFALTAENGPAIAEICRRLDGLPLAIELAAARTGVLGPDALLRRLAHRLPLLTSGAADAPARQRTLRDTIAWSYDLLQPADRTVFARLSAFVGGFTLRAAEAIVPDPTDPSVVDLLDVLSRLVDQNLVRVRPDADAEGEPRFSLLETIREFADEHLAEADRQALRTRHAVHFAGLAEAAGHDPGRQRRRMTVDLDNLRAALEWVRDHGQGELLMRLAVALAPFLVLRGDYREAGQWLQAADGLATTVDPALRANLLVSRATYELWYGADRARAETRFSEALHIYEAVGNCAGMANALFRLAAMSSDLGEPATAADRMDRALAAARKVDDRREKARLLVLIAGGSRGTGFSADVHALADEAIRLGREVDDPVSIMWGLHELGWAALASRDTGTAIKTLSESNRIEAQVVTFGGTGLDGGLAIARLRAGEVEAARTLLEIELRRADSIGERWLVMALLEAAAEWLGATGRAAQATACWAVVDVARATWPDRTPGSQYGLFRESRERDRLALDPAADEDARGRGAAMTLREAVDYAIQELDAAAGGPDPRARALGRRGPYDLTPREHEVLELLAAGRSDGEIGQALFISKKTAAVHVANIKGKLEAGSRVEIVTIALRRGLVEAAP